MNLYSNDIVLLVSDKDAESTFEGLFSRCDKLCIRQISWKIYVHPERDPGCFLRAHDFLRSMCTKFSHALVIFDKEGCGKEFLSRQDIEKRVEDNLARNGWQNRAAAIVLEPELEIWVWSDSPRVDIQMGWKDKIPKLRLWLQDKSFWPGDLLKPIEPKKAFELSLYESKKRKSATIFKKLAQSVDYNQCRDASFNKFKTTIRSWFPI